MNISQSKRPSPALIVSAIALTFALVGTAVAADPVAKVTKKQVKKIANKQIDKKASNLNVKSAKTAETATNATNAVNAANAAAVGGQAIAKVNYRVAANTAPVTIFTGGGLTIQAQCGAGLNIALNATTTKQDSSIYSFVGTDAAPNDPVEVDLEGGGFDPGTNFDLLAGTVGNVSFIDFEYDALDGSIATGQLVVDETTTCTATGHIIHG